MSTEPPVSPWRPLNHFKFSSMRTNVGIWFLVLVLPVLNGCSDNRIKIDIWYGDSQSFGIPGNPQRAINILGNINSPQALKILEYSLNGNDFHPLSLGIDGRRLAREGDFNVEIHRHLLLEGMNDLLIRAIDSVGNRAEKMVIIRYTGKETWPLPYYTDWQGFEASGNPYGLDQEKVYLMDGKWRTENGRIRTGEPYYDRILAFGDSTWENYEVRTDVIFYAHSKPEPSPPTFGVAHAAIAFRWPGHDMDDNQPHVKWYPLGATCEFQISAGRDSCRWRMLYGNRPRTENTEWNRPIELGKLYKMAARVETIDLTTSRYSAKLWDADLPESDKWDLVGVKDNETMFSGSALLLSHNTDVSFGNVSIIPLISE
jgi:hypothetical protein